MFWRKSKKQDDPVLDEIRIKHGFNAIMLFGILIYCLIIVDTVGRKISWGNTVHGGSSDNVMLQSDGTPIDATFNFELGSFGTFVPTASNTAVWEDNWKPFDQATYNETAQFFRSDSTLQQPTQGTDPSGDFPTSTDTFPAGEQAYVWIYNDKNVTTETEWALITGNDPSNPWVFPTATGPLDPGSESFTVGTADGSIAGSATDVIFGGLINETGDGIQQVDPSNPFEVQTHNLIIPEPSSTVLLLLAGCGLLSRRRRTA